MCVSERVPCLCVHELPCGRRNDGTHIKEHVGTNLFQPSMIAVVAYLLTKRQMLRKQHRVPVQTVVNSGNRTSPSVDEICKGSLEGQIPLFHNSIAELAKQKEQTLTSIREWDNRTMGWSGVPWRWLGQWKSS